VPGVPHGYHEKTKFLFCQVKTRCACRFRGADYEYHNENSQNFFISYSWTFIYSGLTGIDPSIAPARSVYVSQQNFSNTIVYRSYRFLVTSQRNLSDAVQYAEAQIIGYI